MRLPERFVRSFHVGLRSPPISAVKTGFRGNIRQNPLWYGGRLKKDLVRPKKLLAHTFRLVFVTNFEGLIASGVNINRRKRPATPCEEDERTWPSNPEASGSWWPTMTRT